MDKMNIWNFGVNNISYILCLCGCGIIRAFIRIICALRQLGLHKPLPSPSPCLLMKPFECPFFLKINFRVYWISLNSLSLSLHLTFNSYIFESFICETHLIVFIWNFDCTVFYKLISVIPPMGKMRGPWSSECEWFCGD